MPIQIDRKTVENLAGQFDEALEPVRNEFEGLEAHRQYRNAFARLLKFEAAAALLRQNPEAADLASTTDRAKACGASPNRNGSSRCGERATTSLHAH